MKAEHELIKLLNQLDAKNARFIVAVSGGMDSMCLLHACLANKLDIIVAHCNYQLRESDSDADMQLVIDRCRLHQVRCITQHFNTKEVSLKTGKSIQETARELRYQWFEGLRKENNADYILTAHHGNDLIETFFINACRGSGITGLSSIPKKNGCILRPWLAITQLELKEYATANKIAFRQDVSNNSLKYTRNYIRHQIVPNLNNINPQSEVNLIQSIHHLKQASDILEEKIEELKQKYVVINDSSIVIKHQQLISFSYINTLLHHWLSPYGFDSQTIQEVSQQSLHTGSLWLSKHYQLLYNRGELIITGLTKTNTNSSIVIDRIEDNFISWNNRVIHIEILSTVPTHYDKGALYLDVSKITLPLYIRTWKHGDQFIPLGMTSPKKMSDFFIDSKISLNDKQETPIICQGNLIVAVLPFRIDERFKLTATTQQVMRVTLIKKKEGA